MLKNGLKRRDFIKILSVGGSGLLVGCTFNSHKIFSEGNEKDENLGLFVHIKVNNQITIISPNSELGQGIHTAHAMIICEE